MENCFELLNHLTGELAEYKRIQKMYNEEFNRCIDYGMNETTNEDMSKAIRELFYALHYMKLESEYRYYIDRTNKLIEDLKKETKN